MERAFLLVIEKHHDNIYLSFVPDYPGGVIPRTQI